MPVKYTLDDQGAFERVNKVLDGIEGGAAQAVRKAMKRTAQAIRTGAIAAVREKYDIAPSAIRENENARVSYEITPKAIEANV